MSSTGTILDRIVAVKREALAVARRSRPLAVVRQAAEDERKARLRGASGGVRPFAASLKQSVGDMAIIAELKRASPSAGVICSDWDPVAIAQAYRRGGASSISVLTEEAHFLGHPGLLRQVREVVDLPLLRKDFLFEPYQVYESMALGADALLLIVALLEPEPLAELMVLAREVGLEALVEVHDEVELDQALVAGATVIGINNRDLRTFNTTLEVTERLAPRVPQGVTLVTESGIRTHADLVRLAPLGVRAALVGEHLLRQGSAEENLRRLLGNEE